jgi:cell division septum initiation protein DivIVA
LTQAAEQESRRIVARAENDADEVRRGADEYAVSVLLGLETDVSRTLQSIRKGIAVLDDRRADLEPEAAADEANGKTPLQARDEVEGTSEPARL